MTNLKLLICLVQNLRYKANDVYSMKPIYQTNDITDNDLSTVLALSLLCEEFKILPKITSLHVVTMLLFCYSLA